MLRRKIFSEGILCWKYAQDGCQTRVMIDVGAHSGGSLRPFAHAGWRVIAIEPCRARVEEIEAKYGLSNVDIVAAAVGASPADSQTLYTSEESTGITSLVPFRSSHQEAEYVQVVTLESLLAEKRVSAVGFLKIDAEGMDYAVLRGHGWQTIRPELILCEYEDAKTKLTNHNHVDIGRFLLRKGYQVWASQWAPIERYGVPHRWLRIDRYEGQALDEAGWGNFIALRDDKDPKDLERFFPKKSSSC